MDWTAEELVSMDRKTKEDIGSEWLSTPRKEGEGGCLVLSSVSRRRAKPAWLPEKKHRVGANGFEGKGAC